MIDLVDDGRNSEIDLIEEDFVRSNKSNRIDLIDEEINEHFQTQIKKCSIP